MSDDGPRLAALWDRAATAAALDLAETAELAGLEVPPRLTLRVVLVDGRVTHTTIDTHEVAA